MQMPSPLEISSVIFNFLSVVLTLYRNIWLWPTGIIGCVLTYVFFVQQKLYADAMLQIFFFVLSIYGWWRWVRGSTASADNTLPITNISLKEITLVALLAIAGIAGLGYRLDNYTDASLPYWDSAIAAWSIAAQWMLARKYLQNWLVWIAVDILCIGVFWVKSMYLYCGLYVIFLCLATNGYFTWRKTFRLETA